jgi:hypothetical protein
MRSAGHVEHAIMIPDTLHDASRWRLHGVAQSAWVDWAPDMGAGYGRSGAYYTSGACLSMVMLWLQVWMTVYVSVVPCFCSKLPVTV